MECMEIRTIEKPAEQSLEFSAEPCIRSMVEQYAARGAVKAVMDTAGEQIRREEETRALAPDSYRLSTLTETAVNLQYRRGKEHMSSADLVRYFEDTRSIHLQATDLSGDTGIDACTGGNTKEACQALIAQEKTRVHAVSVRARQLPRQAGERLKAALPTWFDSSEPDTSGNRHRFPLSAFAAMLAVAMSLLLIVASSVMIRLAESDVSRLQTQISEVSLKADELKSDFEAGNDLLQLRQIATEEYGMVGEEYVKMDYISLRSDDSVEVYEEEREKTLGLSALLSAIGLK